MPAALAARATTALSRSTASAPVSRQARALSGLGAENVARAEHRPADGADALCQTRRSCDTRRIRQRSSSPMMSPDRITSPERRCGARPPATPKLIRHSARRALGRERCRQQRGGAVRVAAADDHVEPGGARDPRLRGEPAGTQHHGQGRHHAAPAAARNSQAGALYARRARWRNTRHAGTEPCAKPGCVGYRPKVTCGELASDSRR